MKKVIGIGLLSLIVAACSSTSTNQAPTHRWASTNAADEIQYRQDVARCNAKANIDNSQRTLDPTSPAFAAYKQCMNNRGYELTAYTE